jgi:hypothetical protein
MSKISIIKIISYNDDTLIMNTEKRRDHGHLILRLKEENGFLGTILHAQML